MAFICYHGTKPYNIDQSRANIIVNIISDPYKRKIISCIKNESKSVRQISYETGFPPSTVYRKIKVLKKNKLLILSALINLENHKKVFRYKSKFHKVSILYDDDAFELKIYSNLNNNLK